MQFIDDGAPGIAPWKAYEEMLEIVKKLNIDSDKIHRIINNLEKYFE